MKALVSLVIFLVVMFGGAYLSLWFFSRLSTVDMFAAMSWGFKAKRFELVLTWCMFYLIASIMVLVLAQKPFRLLTMNLTHEGALLGYAENSESAKLYDPDRSEYVSRRITTPPQAAHSFDQTFEVVTVYRPFLSNYYENVELQNLYLGLFFIFLAGLGLSLMYLTMFALAGDYITKMHLANHLSHQLILSQFREITRVPFSMILTGCLLFVFLSSFIGSSMATRITRTYEEKFAQVRDSFKNQIMPRLEPNQIVRGRVVKRMFDYRKIYADPQGPRPDDDQTIPIVTYTFGFEELIQDTPVYLSITYQGDNKTNPTIERLDQFFPPRQSTWSDVILASAEMMEPTDAREFEFSINSDYSITLLPENK